MGLINHYYYYRIRSELGASSFHAKLSFFAPQDPGYVEDISAAGVLKSSAPQSAAQKFLAFLASAAGQGSSPTARATSTRWSRTWRRTRRCRR